MTDARQGSRNFSISSSARITEARSSFLNLLARRDAGSLFLESPEPNKWLSKLDISFTPILLLALCSWELYHRIDDELSTVFV